MRECARCKQNWLKELRTLSQSVPLRDWGSPDMLGVSCPTGHDNTSHLLKPAQFVLFAWRVLQLGLCERDFGFFRTIGRQDKFQAYRTCHQLFVTVLYLLAYLLCSLTGKLLRQFIDQAVGVFELSKKTIFTYPLFWAQCSAQDFGPLQSLLPN